MVVGGKNSANTRHLADICREIQPRTWHVETEAELSCLRAEGCDEGQGFLFSKARPNAEIISLLAAQRGIDATDDEDAALVA